MNLDATRVVLRPRSLGEIFDLAARVYVEIVPRLFLRLWLVTVLPAFALLLVLHATFGLGWAELWLAAIGAAMVLQGVFTVGIGQAMFEREVRPRDVLRQFVGRFFPYWGALLISRFFLALGWLFAFFVVPPAIVAAKVLFVHEACLLERASGMEASGRASRMAAGSGMVRFACFAALAVLAQFGFIVSVEMLLNDGLLDFVCQIGKPFGSLFEDGGSPFALLGFFLSVPFVAIARYLAYVDTRTRRDGWDIQLRFMAIRNAAREDVS